MKKIAKIIIYALITAVAIVLIAYFVWLYTVLGTDALYIIFKTVLYVLGAVLLVLLAVRVTERFVKKRKEKDKKDKKDK